MHISVDDFRVVHANLTGGDREEAVFQSAAMIGAVVLALYGIRGSRTKS
jgi:hypothetical protein